jgi:hypothetical protein
MPGIAGRQPGMTLDRGGVAAGGTGKIKRRPGAGLTWAMWLQSRGAVRACAPDRMVVFAIGRASPDIGGYGGRPPGR